MEGKLISERRIDKTPPVITVTDPSVNRGLKVTASGKDVMVKGMAVDPSGIKSVSINGTAVYTKEGGDFWGSVILKEGMNKLNIVATDLAGNTAEQVFEIEKQTAPISVDNDIIPTTERKGKISQFLLPVKITMIYQFLH